MLYIEIISVCSEIHTANLKHSVGRT